jgi:mannan endo-1,4-beta-mannosidase
MRRSDKVIVAVVVLAIALVGAFYLVVHRARSATVADSGPLPATPGHYFGVAEANEIGSYAPVEKFAKAVGREPNVVLYYSAWGDPFEKRLALNAYQHGAIPFVQISPGPLVTMAAVAAGKYDAYLRSYAHQVRDYVYPVIVGFAPEMNGNWDRWGWHHTKPSVWIAAWRHVVTVFRQQGADNVTWLWTVNASSKGTGPLQQWWPGAAYVTWVGIDGYYFYHASTFASTFDQTIDAIHALTSKPILLSETGIGQVAGQAQKIPDLFDGVRAARVLGFVWFDQNQDDGIYHQRWRLETNAAGLAVFRRELASSGMGS